MTTSLPQRKVGDLAERLETWPPRSQVATVREVLVLAENLLHLNGEELTEGSGVWGLPTRSQAEAECVTELTPVFLWQTWRGGGGTS